MSFEDKIDVTRNKTLLSLENDKKLEAEILKHLGEAFHSTYEPYVAEPGSDDYKYAHSNPDVLHIQKAKHGGYYYYYIRNNFRSGLHRDNLAIGMNVIESLTNNRRIVTARLDGYKIILHKLDQVVEEHKQKEKFRQLSERVNDLQEKNIGMGGKTDNLAMEADYLNELDQLLHSVQHIETLDKSELLKHNSEVLSQNIEQGGAWLKQINGKLR